MKIFLLLIILTYTTLHAQNKFSQATGKQLDYYKSNFNDLRNENGISINNSIESDSLVFIGEAIGNHFGVSVSTAGDVNGDGFSDVIVGADIYNSSTGRVYIFYGGVNMDKVADVTLTGEAGGDNFGNSVSNAGDVNGDGFSDVIVGAFWNNWGIGRTYIFYGGVNMDNIADVTMTGESTGDWFGCSVSTAGDVNGDGFSDVIVGADKKSNNRGRSYIYFGGSSMNNIADVIMIGEREWSGFGISVSTAGDVNGDGFSDVIVGADTFLYNSGRAYIYYGGLVMDNIVDVTMSGGSTGLFGNCVSNAGDVNGDGFSDVIVGSYPHSRTYIFFGGSSMNNIADVIMASETGNNRFGVSVSSAGDVNKDGFSDVIVGDLDYVASIGELFVFYGGLFMDNVPDTIIQKRSEYNRFGFSVSEAGDINGDGYSDVIVGDIDESDSGKGKAYLYLDLMPKPYLIHPNNGSINNPLTINFKWNKINTAINYVLIISTDYFFNNIIVNDTISIDTSKTINGFQKGNKYYWKVKAKDNLGNTFSSSIWNFTSIPPIYSNVKILFEGMYSPVFNQLTRKDTINVYLRNTSPPYSLVDSAKGTIDSVSYTGLFNFINATSGTYYIVAKHINNIETWSKIGGELLINNYSIYNYDFTASNSQAYGNNLKLKGTKYCMYSGDVNQDGYITLFDVIPIYNDAINFVTGRYLTTDLTGDNIVDLTDVTICYNNSANFVSIRRP